jgi:hypothetical protein
MLSGYGVPDEHKAAVAERAVDDAVTLAVDLRDQDPAEVWRRLARWWGEDPNRVIAAAFAAAAMVPVDDASARELLAWIDRPLPGLRHPRSA